MEQPTGSTPIQSDWPSCAVLADGRMYQLVREHGTVREQTLEITFQESGAEAYSFTFG